MRNLDALRVGTTDHLRNRRVFRTTTNVKTNGDDPPGVDVLCRKGKGKGEVGKGKKGGNKGKGNHSGKGDGGQSPKKPSHFVAECRKSGLYGHHAAVFGHEQTKLQGKGQAKSQVSEVSESENSKHVPETWTLVSSPQPSSSSQGDLIRGVGCADEGLWIFLAGRQCENIEGQ